MSECQLSTYRKSNIGQDSNYTEAPHLKQSSMILRDPTTITFDCNALYKVDFFRASSNCQNTQHTLWDDLLLSASTQAGSGWFEFILRALGGDSQAMETAYALERAYALAESPSDTSQVYVVYKQVAESVPAELSRSSPLSRPNITRLCCATWMLALHAAFITGLVRVLQHVQHREKLTCTCMQLVQFLGRSLCWESVTVLAEEANEQLIRLEIQVSGMAEYLCSVDGHESASAVVWYWLKRRRR